MEFTYDDSNLERLFAELDPKQRLKALKGGFRRTANEVRKIAVGNLRSSGINSNRQLEKGIRALVFKRKAGFRVAIGGSMYVSRGIRKREAKKEALGIPYIPSKGKPVLTFAEGGTAPRRQRIRIGRWGHRTGLMPRYAFMEKTLEEVRGSVTERLHAQIRENVQKVALKYGCR